MANNTDEEPTLYINEESLFQLLINQIHPGSNQTVINEFRENFTRVTSILKKLSEEPDLIRKEYLKNSLIIIVYTLIIIVSLFGNLLVCKVIVSQRLLRNRTTNLLILNLTVSDLLMTILAIPVTVTRFILDDWPFGKFLCVSEPLIQVTSVYVSSMTMAVIALDRYQVLVYPMKDRLLNKMSKVLILALIWIICGLFSTPHSIYNQIVELYAFGPVFRCRTVYPSPQVFYRKFFALFTTLTQYLIPLSVTLFTYGLIALKIHKRAHVGEMTEEQHRRRLKFKKKTIKMLMIVVIVFAVCWLPINTFNIIRELFHFERQYFGYKTYLFCHWLAFSSVCWNPFIYFGLNTHYRQELKKIFSFNSTATSPPTRSSQLMSSNNYSRTSDTKSNIRFNHKEYQTNCNNSENVLLLDSKQNYKPVN